jgi:hypothetical protein
MKKVLLAIAIVVMSLIVSFRMPDRRWAQPVAACVQGGLCNTGSSLPEKKLNEAPFIGWDDQALFTTASQRP